MEPGAFAAHWRASGTTDAATLALVGFRDAELALLAATDAAGGGEDAR